MSPLYLPFKRKPLQTPKPAASVVHHDPDGASELNSAEYTKNDTTLTEPDALTTQMNGRKRFEDLQSVPLTSIDYASSSCSVMSPAALTNGTDPGFMAPPPSRPPHVVPKDDWTLAESSRDQTWTEAWLCGKVHSGPDSWSSERDGTRLRPEKTWGTGPEGGPESGWTRARDRGQDLGWSMGPGPDRETGWREEPWSSTEPIGRNDMNVKKAQTVELENLPQPAGGSCDPAAVKALDQKPTAVCVKKEPPVYPPGSEEERWQLQIVAKGRVTCPKCKSVSRKTVEGLKKHMDNCRLQPFSCPHCGKQLKSSTGMKYHIMADHSLLPSSDVRDQDDRAVKEKLRKILKRLGKLKCSREGCSAAFTSIMGYFYHTRKCGKEQSELEKMVLNCSHCNKTYKSKAGLEYHLKSEHAPAAVKMEEEEEQVEAQIEENPERTASGRVQRASAQVANFHLAEIANNDLPKDWPKRKFQSDLVPDDKKLKYSRPGLPAFSQELLRKWKNEVKLQRKVQCPNEGCGCTYTSVSGLKAHLGLCTKGDFEAGKYRCLICNKEFNSESGVKYHINSVHSQDWFVTNKKASKKFEKLLKNQPKDFHRVTDKHFTDELFQHQHLQHFLPQPPLHQLQPQNHFLRPGPQPLPPQTDPQTPQTLQTDPQTPQSPPALHYTPLQPVWDEDVKETEQDREQRNCLVFLGEDGSSGVNLSGLSDELQRQRLSWDVKRPGLTVDAAKRQ